MRSPTGVQQLENYYQNYIIIKIRNARLVRPTIYPGREWEINRISRKKNAFSKRSLAIEKLLSKL